MSKQDITKSKFFNNDSDSDSDNDSTPTTNSGPVNTDDKRVKSRKALKAEKALAKQQELERAKLQKKQIMKKKLKEEQESTEEDTDNEEDDDDEEVSSNKKVKMVPEKKSKFDDLTGIDRFSQFDGFDETNFLEIHIKVVNRNARKRTTTIEGIPNDLFEDKQNVNKFLTKLRNVLSASVSLKNVKGSNIIIASGSDTDGMIPLLMEFADCSLDNIKVHKV